MGGVNLGQVVGRLFSSSMIDRRDLWGVLLGSVECLLYVVLAVIEPGNIEVGGLQPLAHDILKVSLGVTACEKKCLMQWCSRRYLADLKVKEVG